jgi:hypothetical protein
MAWGLVSYFETAGQGLYGDRVVPVYLQAGTGVKGVKTAFLLMADAYTGWVVGVSGQAREGGIGGETDRSKL